MTSLSNWADTDLRMRDALVSRCNNARKHPVTESDFPWLANLWGLKGDTTYFVGWDDARTYHILPDGTVLEAYPFDLATVEVSDERAGPVRRLALMMFGKEPLGDPNDSPPETSCKQRIETATDKLRRMIKEGRITFGSAPKLVEAMQDQKLEPFEPAPNDPDAERWYEPISKAYEYTEAAFGPYTYSTPINAKRYAANNIRLTRGDLAELRGVTFMHWVQDGWKYRAEIPDDSEFADAIADHSMLAIVADELVRQGKAERLHRLPSTQLLREVEEFDAALAAIKTERVESTRVGNARVFGSMPARASTAVTVEADPDADTAPISIRDGDTLQVNLGRVPMGATPTPWGYEDQLERFCYIRIPRNRYIKVITSTVVKHGSPADLLTLIGLMGDDVAWFDETGTPIQSLEVR